MDALNDHNKPAEAHGLANRAFDADADLPMGVQNPPTAMVTGTALPALTRAACSRCVDHYSFDSVAIGSATANHLAALPDGKHRVVIAADAGTADADAVTEPHGWHEVLATVPAAAFPAGSECRLTP